MSTRPANPRQKSIWHVTLFPAVKKDAASNGLPKWLGKRYLHPTHATLTLRQQDGHDITEHHPCTSYEKHEDGLGFTQHWTSRNHRKHRLVCVGPAKPHRSRHASNLLVGLWHMATRIEYWNVSWWVAQAFTWGSVVWCLNGFFAFLPLLYPSTFAESVYSTGWTAFIGATIFEFGSVLGMWEAWNRDDVSSFGWNVNHRFRQIGSELHDTTYKAFGEIPQTMKEIGIALHRASTHGYATEQKLHRTDPEKGVSAVNGHDATVSPDSPLTGTSSPDQIESPHPPEFSFKRRWIWFSTDTKYFREVGFLAAAFQMFGATVFWISGFTALPTIQLAIKNRTGVLDGVFWVPQVVGGMGFVISSTFIMLETQTKWYKIRPLNIGWHVGFWNFIGGIGFTACGALGFAAASNSGVNFQSVLCTFWGSWAFLIGSLLQWYESVNSK
ncbi:hypothetical protein MD484_g4562, partial [Candolleomyces efflorescens]